MKRVLSSSAITSGTPLFNVSLRKVGGLTFLKLGRINISWSVSRPAPVPVPETVYVRRIPVLDAYPAR